MSDISGRLKNLSPEQLKLLKARLQKEGIDIEKDIKVSKEKRPPAIEPVEAREYYVVSSVQKRLCMIAQMEEVGTAYNMSWVLTLGGDLDTEWLEEVFRRLIQRHEVFRTSFRSLDINSKLVQRIHEEVEFQIRHHNPQSTDPSVHQAIVRDFSQPFDLAKAPLLRVGLIRLNETQHVLMVDTHHIISDLSSRKIIFNEFISLYKRESLPPINIQYKDFAQWLDSEAAKKELKRQESYWLKTFEKEPQMINLPVDFERPANKSYEGGVLGITVERSEAAALNAFALKENTTLFVVVLSMYNIFLSKICRQSDIVVGIPTSGRNFPGLASMLGMFINSMALRNYPEGQKTFKEFVQQVKTRTLDSFENPDYPFEDLVAKVVKTRDAARNPVFDVFFSFTYPHVETAESEELPAAVDFPLKLGPYARDIEKHRLLSMFDLYLHGLKLKDDISLGLTYCSSLFKKETIERFAGYFKDILSAVMENNEIKIEDIKISHDLGIAQTNVFQDEDDEFDF